jgi:hypothetical protein
LQICVLERCKKRCKYLARRKVRVGEQKGCMESKKENKSDMRKLWRAGLEE